MCSYGCGKESQFRLKNGKWCCSKFYNSCDKSREKTGIISKLTHNTDEYKNRCRIKTILQREKETEEQKLNRINKLKAKFNDENFKKDLCLKIKESMKLKKCGEVISKKAIERYKKNPQILESISKKQTERFKNIDERKKLSNILKLNIEKISEKYPAFLDLEEIRYNPDKPIDKEIQVRCKNKNCINSKENNGWFTPTRSQINNRIFVSKHKFGNSYFFCSDKCKLECEFFNIRIDPETLERYIRYKKRVIRETNRNLRCNYNKISNIELRGLKYGFDLDHKVSMYDGFINDVDPKIIGHWKNLEILNSKINRNIKNKNSSMLIDELIEMVNNNVGTISS